MVSRSIREAARRALNMRHFDVQILGGISLFHGAVAEMETGEDSEFTADSGEFGEEFAGYSWRVTVDEVDLEALGEISEDLKQIEVIVTYYNDEFIYRLRTLRFIRKE